MKMVKKNIPLNLKDYEEVKKTFSWQDFHKEFSWHKSGKVNYAYEVTDYQVLKGNGKKYAIISQKQSGNIEKITFKQLAEKSSILAKQLQLKGLKPGDRFGIYAQRSIEYAIVLMAVVKCGAIAVPLFPAFGIDAIADRVNDCGCFWLYVTSDLIKNINPSSLPTLKNILTNEKVTLKDVNSYLLSDFLKGNSNGFSIQFADLETPFIIHYTSGSTAKPKGILLVSRAMIGHLVTSKYVLDLHPQDHYWNTGDPGWVTGMVYNFFAPLLLGVTAYLYEGPFQPLEWIKFMAKMKINVWYSTPTAFRLLRYYGAPLTHSKVPTLRHIVSAGEPLNPSLIDWTMENLGIPIHDSWYMTENGHQLINNYRCLPIKKGSMGKPLPGIKAGILDEDGKQLKAEKIGRLAIKTPWPGLMKTVWNNPKRFEAYFKKGWYISGDVAYKDKDGYFWFQGREDDMIKSAAERISPFEIESTLVTHPSVAEAGVIGVPDEVFGSIIKAFVMLKPGIEESGKLKTELIRHVKEHLATHEVPRQIEFVKKLPKTKSGKIMRRVLRSQETHTDTGDLSTLDVEMNPNSVQDK
jgi:acetyl-CoA synthetase